MSDSSPPIGHVRIIRCAHGTNFVTLGPVTLHLTDAELALVDRSIRAVARREPALRAALSAAAARYDAGATVAVAAGSEDWS